ncbi:hypothetical protein EMIT0P43_100079 [Pseudomonas jessenii]
MRTDQRAKLLWSYDSRKWHIGGQINGRSAANASTLSGLEEVDSCPRRSCACGRAQAG